MLRTPNADRAPKPRMEMRASCVGLLRFATVTPGSPCRVSSTSRCVWPGSLPERITAPIAQLSGRTTPGREGFTFTHAVVPSVVYGLWGFYFLIPTLKPVEQWFTDTFSFIPFLGP